MYVYLCVCVCVCVYVCVCVCVYARVYVSVNSTVPVAYSDMASQPTPTSPLVVDVQTTAFSELLSFCRQANRRA